MEQSPKVKVAVFNKNHEDTLEFYARTYIKIYPLPIYVSLWKTSGMNLYYSKALLR